VDKLFADCNSGCVSVPCYGVVCGNTIPFLLMIVVLTCGRKISHILETAVHMQVRMPETDNTEKIQYLHYFLSMALPVLKQIHRDECLELEAEAKIQGEYLVVCFFAWG